MKLCEIKLKVFDLLSVTETKQLKKNYPHLVRGKDLRYRVSWSDLLNQLLVIEADVGTVTLETLQETDEYLRQSFFETHRFLGYSDDKIEVEWQRIALEAQFSDIHIEEL